MSWAKSRPGGKGYVAPLYRTKQHKQDRAAHLARLAAAGSGTCAEIVCLMTSRLITLGMDLHLCHDRRTGRVLGLGHARCNRSEAARHARAKQSGQTVARPVVRRRWA